MGNRKVYDMIKTFEQHIIQPHNKFLSLVGIPSGEFFELSVSQFIKLNDTGMITSNKSGYFTFRDEDYDKIMNIIGNNQLDKIKSFLIKNKITNYRILPDLTVEVFHNVKIIEKMSVLPVKFDFILGDFDISHCGLTTLKGCPERVEGDFICENNQLYDLSFGPTTVDGDYNARTCRLKSLKGSPRHIVENFNVGENEIQDLELGPIRVDGSYYCDNCLLITLEGCAETISNNFDCSFNYLTNLKGGPQKINGMYDCSNNKLKTLRGGPTNVRVFKCNGNLGLSKEGMPIAGKIISDDTGN